MPNLRSHRRSPRRAAAAAGLVVALALGASSRAQDAAALLPRSAPAASDWVVPLHELPADPVHGAYGWWAAGPDYKVSFGDDGVTFYPRVGSDRAHRPVRWRTEAVGLGPVRLLDVHERAGYPQPEIVRDGTRCRFDWGGGVVERWDVGRAGVEQSFVVAAPSAGRRGQELVVRGRFDTTLRVEPEVGVGTAEQCGGALRFVDPADGSVLVGYSAALAIDASGAESPVDTRLGEDGVVELVVPAAWLDDATWPVTIDPLLSTQLVAFGEFADVDVGNHDRGGQDTMVCGVREFAAGDNDVVAYTLSSGLANPTFVFADVSTQWTSAAARVAWVERADRWTVAFDRETRATSSIHVYVHDRTSAVLNSGFVMNKSPSTLGAHDSLPDIGGSTGDGTDDALLVFQSDGGTLPGNTTHSEVWATYVDAAQLRFFDEQIVANAPVGSTFDREHPAVCQVSYAGDAGQVGPVWGVAFQQRNSTRIGGDNWVAWGQVLAVNAPKATASELFTLRSEGSIYDGQVDITGANDGRYAVTGVGSTFPQSTVPFHVGLERFNWSPGAGTTPNSLWFEIVRTEADTDFAPRVAYDLHTGSHWLVTYRVDNGIGDDLGYTRYGFDGSVVETDVLWDQLGAVVPSPAAVAYHTSFRRWQFAWHGFSAGFAPSLYGRLLVSPRDAAATTYGTACGPSTIGSLRTPLVGSQFWAATLTGAPASAPASLLVSTGPGSTPLASIGLPGCELLLDPAVLISLPGDPQTSGLQFAVVTLPFVGDLACQWFYLDAGAPGGAGLSDGLSVRVR